MHPRKIPRSLIFLFIIATFFLSRTTPASAQDNSSRNIAVTVFADSELLEKNAEQTEREIKEIIEFVANIFKKEFGAILVLRAIKPWEFPRGETEINASRALVDIQQKPEYKDSDIILGFTKKNLYRMRTVTNDDTLVQQKEYVGGLAFIADKVAVIQNDELIALHEVGHIFGANHSKDASSVMYQYPQSKNFDNENKIIIQKNIKERFFEHRIP